MPRTGTQPHNPSALWLAERRRFLARAAGLGIAALGGGQARSALGATSVALPFGNGERPVATAFPQKGAMILQRTRPPLLETPFEVFDQGVFTPNDRFFVRWHLGDIPTTIDPATFRLKIRGHVNKTVELSLDDLVHKFERVELAAVNQCSGNSRGHFAPRVAGAQWSNVANVKVSVDGGRQCQLAQLGGDYGKYSFRQWNAAVRFAAPGAQRVMVMATNTSGISQPPMPNWNASGMMRNVIETASIRAS